MLSVASFLCYPLSFGLMLSVAWLFSAYAIHCCYLFSFRPPDGGYIHTYTCKHMYTPIFLQVFMQDVILLFCSVLQNKVPVVATFILRNGTELNLWPPTRAPTSHRLRGCRVPTLLQCDLYNIVLYSSHNVPLATEKNTNSVPQNKVSHFTSSTVDIVLLLVTW